MVQRLTDCHFHTFGDVKDFPIVGAAAYVPIVSTLEQHSALLAPHGKLRRVIIAASAYGTDNRCHMNDLRRIGLKAGNTGRAIVSISRETPDAELAEMNSHGAKGARFNSISPGAMGFEELYANADRMRALGWHAELYARPEHLAEQAERLLATGLDFSVAHYGDLDPAKGLSQPAVTVLTSLLATGKCWLKLSAPYRSSTAPGFADMEPYARHFLTARPDRMLWGSDWPYVHHEARLVGWDPLTPLIGWMTPSEADAVLWQNPTNLYGFPP